MIMNERTYRKMKNALLALPGAPSSARMGEFMAAAMDIGDYQSLQDYLDRVETGFGIPEHVEINIDAALEKLSEFGCHGWPASDIVATFVALNYDGLLWDMANDHEEIRGAAVIRYDHVSDRWRAAVENAWNSVRDLLKVDNLQVDINTLPGWAELEEFHEIGKYIMTGGPCGGAHAVPLSNDQLLRDLELTNQYGWETFGMIENIILMTREALPDFNPVQPAEGQNWITRKLMLDNNGVRIGCQAENCDFGFDIWFACFENGKIPRP